MKSSVKIVLVLIAASSSPLAFSAEGKCYASPEAVPLCTVVSEAAKYDGKEITVRGRYRMLIHGSILMDGGCPESNVNLLGAANEKADKHALAVLHSFYKKKINRFQPVDEVLRGTFRVAHQGECFGQDCWTFEIEVTELPCAEPPKQP